MYGTVRAHYRMTFRRFREELTFSQVFLAYEECADYLRLTAPFGGGDAEEQPQHPGTVVSDADHFEIARRNDVFARQSAFDDLPTQLQMQLIDEGYIT